LSSDLSFPVASHYIMDGNWSSLPAGFGQVFQSDGPGEVCSGFEFGVCVLSFEVWGLGSGVWGLGFGVRGAGSEV
jgi:hypothetical protein